jgi:predicted metal-dependent hydrolase
LISRFWRWHTNWCPGWKAYVQELKSKGLEVPQV